MQLAQYDHKVREGASQVRDAMGQLQACTEALQGEREAREAAVQRRDQLQARVTSSLHLCHHIPSSQSHSHGNPPAFPPPPSP